MIADGGSAGREAGMQFVPQKEGKRKKVGISSQAVTARLSDINSKQATLSVREEGKEEETESHVKKGNQSCDTIMNEKSKPTRNLIPSSVSSAISPNGGGGGVVSTSERRRFSTPLLQPLGGSSGAKMSSKNGTY